MKSVGSLLPSLVEVFRTESGCVYQSDVENCYYVEFAGKTVKFKIKCLFRLKSIVDNIDLARMAADTRRASDVEIISLCACEHCYVLNLTQIVAFRDLLAGTKVMLELNSIIHERLRRLPVKSY
jgi:transcriptional antiterminator Rof (Rho-off)